MRTLHSLIEDIFTAEGDTYGDKTTTPPIDQPTGRGGITAETYQAFLKAQGEPESDNPARDLRLLSRERAEAIVEWKLAQVSAEMGLSYVAFEPLRLFLLDFGYNSGGPRALRWLQRLLAVPATGKMDGMTANALQHENPRLVHQAMLAARLQMVDEWTDASKERKQWEEGLENRILSFSLIPKS